MARRTNATRKFPVGTTDLEEPSLKAEFVIPDCTGSTGSGFVGIRSGKRWPYGCVSLIGRSVVASDVVDRASDRVRVSLQNDEAIEIIDRFISELGSLKIGNVISIDYGQSGEFVLSLCRARPTQKKRKLPK